MGANDGGRVDVEFDCPAIIGDDVVDRLVGDFVGSGVFASDGDSVGSLFIDIDVLNLLVEVSTVGTALVVLAAIGVDVEGLLVFESNDGTAVGSEVDGGVEEGWLGVGKFDGEYEGDFVGSEVKGMDVTTIGSSEGCITVEPLVTMKTTPAFHDKSSSSVPKIMFPVRPSFGTVTMLCLSPSDGNCK